MEPLDMTILGLVAVLTAILLMLALKNRKLEKENALLLSMMEAKEKSVENLSERDKVMHMYYAGESEEQIAEALKMPLDKVEMIIKFDKLKREQHS